ncbi:hypothetical protein BDV40DRAFT_294931 [Aspergillus tamarii]|uniref:Uncharacterized protein n=1 Tax=Aspergillus tamarii TaxID=41984 RepID=A0A5N6VCJ7_ASPTM|nr:hypothetical protein BDV40DRAFT_294931 [Aspergillus tamarii]
MDDFGRKEPSVPFLLKTLALFQEIADGLASEEEDHEFAAIYRYLHGNAMLMVERIRGIKNFGRSENAIANMTLNRFSSLMQDRSVQEQHTPWPGLTELHHNWSILVSWEERLRYLRSHLHFDSKHRWNELVTFLEECVNSLDAPVPYELEEPQARFRKPREPPRFVGPEAKMVFHALTVSSKSCTCNPCHDYAARLKLATYRARGDIDDKCVFDLLLSSTESFWQETHIHATPPQKKAKVTIAIHEQHQKPRKKRGSHRVPVSRLCDHIKPRQIFCCLNLGVEDGQLWKFRSSDNRLPTGAMPISLEKVIEAHPTSLGDKIKRVLAVLLGYCILHLHGTPWLQPSYLNSSNILFLATPTSVPLRPFIHTEVEGNSLSSEYSDELDESHDGVDPDDLPLHSHPSLVMLAILLMEVHMAMPILSLAGSPDIKWAPLQSVDENSRYRIATEAFKKCASDFSDNYRGAVAKCLDPDIGFDSDDNELDEVDLKRLIYEEIVQRLEDELDQGFSETISSDNLDEVAPTLNLNSWGTMELSFPGQTDTHTTHYHTTTIPSRSSTPLSQFTDFRTASQNSVAVGNGIPRWEPQVSQQRSQSIPIHLNLCHPLTYRSYTVGWICALAEEMAVARAMLDNVHPGLPRIYTADNNNYILGSIGPHNVVLACLPDGVMGTTSAAIVAHRMRSTFQEIQFGLMVGIGGAAPNATDDIRLGDVVVGVPRRGSSGVIQYDFGKTVQEGKVTITSSLNRPPDVLLTAVNNLRSEHLLLGHKIRLYLDKMVDQYPRLKATFSHPGLQYDTLYQSHYDHPADHPTCSNCDTTKLVPRTPRSSPEPRIHYGLIASGNQVMKHGLTRDRLKAELDIKCFEMEAAGLVDDFPCLVIRGVSDYSDSHKNDSWRGYAAAAAAAYAKELLSSISGCQHLHGNTDLGDCLSK